MELQDALKSVRLHLAKGNFDEARKQLLSLHELQENPEAMALGAKIAGHQQGVEEALAMFLDLEATWPERFEIFKIHCQFLQECNELNAAADMADSLVKKFPQEVQAWQMQIDANELADRLDVAARAAGAAKANFPGVVEFSQANDRLQAILSRFDVNEENLRQIRDEIGVQEVAANDGALVEISRAFRGREGVHAVQTKMGKSHGYLPERREISKDDLKHHLRGDKTLGFYLVTQSNCSYLLALDLDVKKEWLGSFENISAERRRIKNQLKAAASELINLCSGAGLSPLLEYSGNKGLHFWFFSQEPIACRYWRTLGNWLVSRISHNYPELSWEVFPKQDVVKDGGLGNLVKLPLGLHQKTGRRSCFLDPESFKPYADQIEALKNRALLTKESFEKVLGTITIEKCSSENSALIAAKPQAKAESVLNDEEKPFSLRVKIPLPERNTLEVEKVLTGCRPLWAIFEKVRLGQELEENERHAFVYIFAHLGEEGKVFIHQVLNQLENYDPDAVNAMIRAVPPNPTGCSRIRKNLPELCNQFECNCQFRMPDGCYASPVIHAGIFPGSARYSRSLAEKIPPAGLSEIEMLGGTSGSIDRLMHEFERLQQQLQPLHDRYVLLRRQIIRLFDEAGSDVITTRIRTYERHLLEEKDKDCCEMPVDGG